MSEQKCRKVYVPVNLDVDALKKRVQDAITQLQEALI